MRNLRNQEGFSLIEVMIAGTIVGGLALYMADLWVGQAKRQSELTARNTYIQLSQEMAAASNNPAGLIKSSEFMVPLTLHKLDP